jgi:hypothetical protein
MKQLETYTESLPEDANFDENSCNSVNSEEFSENIISRVRKLPLFSNSDKKINKRTDKNRILQDWEYYN